MDRYIKKNQLPHSALLCFTRVYVLPLRPPTVSHAHPLSVAEGTTGAWTEMEGKVVEKQGEPVSGSGSK